jgi:hypothetical protein
VTAVLRQAEPLFFIIALFGSEELVLLNREDAKDTKKEGRRKKEEGRRLTVVDGKPDARIGFISN